MDQPSPHHRSTIFLLFMSLWIIYGILNQYNSLHAITFDPTTVVWSQEVLKIILSLILFFIQDGGLPILYSQVKQHARIMMMWYLIPAGLYALGDVLMYVNLRSFDPATLHLLGEMKLVVTAIVHQCLFQKMLNKWHWLALLIITTGCVVKAVDSLELTMSSDIDDVTTASIDNLGLGDGETTADSNSGTHELTNTMPRPTLFNFALIGMHIMTSTVAGVFNEKLLKDKPSICINLQNLCLYINGMVFLTFGMLVGVSEHDKSITEALSPANLEALFSQRSILLMAGTMSIAGIVTSRFLKVFDSISKSVAVALVVVSLPLLSRLLFGTPITTKMIISLVMVVAGMQLYTSQPPPNRTDTHDGSGNGGKNVANDRYHDAKDKDDEAVLFLPEIALPGDCDIETHSHNGEEHYTSVLQQELPERVPQSALSKETKYSGRMYTHVTTA